MIRLLKLLLPIPIGVTLVADIGYIAKVEGQSMKPTLNADDHCEYVFLNKVSTISHSKSSLAMIQLIVVESQKLFC